MEQLRSKTNHPVMRTQLHLPALDLSWALCDDSQWVTVAFYSDIYIYILTSIECTSLQCHFMPNMPSCLYSVTSLFWQNDGDLSRATAVTWGWNGYRNKSQHRQLTPEKKLPPPLLHGLEPMVSILEPAGTFGDLQPFNNESGDSFDRSR